jgi:PEP-CTERM motif
MKRFISLGIVLSAFGLLTASPSEAGTISASAVITATPDGPDFNYMMTLTNTSGVGNDSIATFWFAWIPNINFLLTSPVSVTPPTGWSDVITTRGAGDGFGIKYQSTTNELAPGSSLIFSFTSTDTPTQIMGTSHFHADPVLESFVYNQTEGIVGPFNGDSFKFDVTFTSVPEPSTLVLGIVGIASLAALRLRRKRAV